MDTPKCAIPRVPLPHLGSHYYAGDVEEFRDEVEASRASWLAASRSASELASELFQPGSGYGDPDARSQDEHRLDSARREADRLFHEYNDLDRRATGRQLLELQRSQQRATWASFAVAAVVGGATIVSVLVSLFM